MKEESNSDSALSKSVDLGARKRSHPTDAVYHSPQNLYHSNNRNNSKSNLKSNCKLEGLEERKGSLQTHNTSVRNTDNTLPSIKNIRYQSSIRNQKSNQSFYERNNLNSLVNRFVRENNLSPMLGNNDTFLKNMPFKRERNPLLGKFFAIS
jgi:hypothetical protein